VDLFKSSFGIRPPAPEYANPEDAHLLPDALILAGGAGDDDVGTGVGGGGGAGGDVAGEGGGSAGGAGDDVAE
jgi:hypothetical protein